MTQQGGWFLPYSLRAGYNWGMSQKYLTVVAQIRSRPGMEEKTREELIKLIAPTRQEEGCIRYDLHFSQSDPAEFLFFEYWTSAEALAKHSESPHLQRFKAQAAELLDGPTRLTLWDPHE